MSDDLTQTWTLRRGSTTQRSRFHLTVEIEAEFVEPTRDEVRVALNRALDEALGPDPDLELAGWTSADTELEHLRRWKAEALPLLETLDHCHDLLPVADRAPLGHSKAQAVYEYIRSRTTYP